MHDTVPKAHKATNLNITTSDNEILGAWFILSDAFYQEFSRSSGRPKRPFVEEELRTSLRKYPTVIFFHGNAANRAAPYRVSLYSSLSTRLAVNVLAIDYRGFGDSTGSPSEAGLLKDGRAAWDWLIGHGAKADSIVIMGHSLGTSVSALLGEQLASEGEYSTLSKSPSSSLA
jgi:abhydrolase domain-containing protein 12